MGWAAGRKLRESVRCLTRVLAVEAVIAARALELRAPLAPAPATAAAADAVRGVAGRAGHDRVVAPELAAAERLVASGGLVDAVRPIVGVLP
jgi:histidine ammonia-lyase